MKTSKIILFALLLLLGCDSDHSLKSGYESRSASKQKINDNVKKELKKRNINFYTYTVESREFIAYRKEDREILDNLFKEVTGDIPDGYSGLCYETMLSAKKQKELLFKNNIPSKIKESYSMFCVRWETKYNDNVAEIDESYRYIREHQRSMGNKI